MKACAEKHVVEALAIQELQLANKPKPKPVDVDALAMEYLCELDRCPGPNCNVPFEHSGIYIYVCVYVHIYICMYVESVHSLTQCRWMCGHVLHQLQSPLLFVVPEHRRRSCWRQAQG